MKCAALRSSCDEARQMPEMNSNGQISANAIPFEVCRALIFEVLQG